MDTNEKVVTLKLKRYAETPNAWLLGPEGEPEKKVWIPKSVCEDHHDGTWTMPEWKAIAKGLENYLAD